MTAGFMPDSDGRALERLSATMKRSRALEDRLRGSALDVNALMMLARIKADGGATAVLLVSELGFSRPKVSRLTTDLIDAGLVDEHLMPDDLRKNHLKVSRRGDNLLVELSQVLGADALASVCEERSSILRALAALRAEEDAHLGFTEAIILIALRLSSDGLSVGDLGEFLAMDQPKASMALRGLRRKGWVTASSLKVDHRVHLFALTAAGALICQAVENRLPAEPGERIAPTAENRLPGGAGERPAPELGAVQNETDESSTFVLASESSQNEN